MGRRLSLKLGNSDCKRKNPSELSQLTQIKPEVMNYSLIKRANWWKKGCSSPWHASLRGGLHVVAGGDHVQYNVVHSILHDCHQQ